MSVEDVWFDDSVWARTARAALTPASAVFGAVVRWRNQQYERGRWHIVPSPIPTLSVGNISVGGTGKTPVSAYFVRRLVEAGRRPALVMRGYGDDEPEVHELLNPGVPVYTGAVRAVGIARAAADGADVAVMDDAFQHRRAGRLVDVVLVSAERWRDGEHLLPAGSLRESPDALRRASLVIVTHKIATPEAVARVMTAVTHAAPDVPVAAMHLRLAALQEIDGKEAPMDLSALQGARVLAVAGVGDPKSFFLQLDALGARVTRRAFLDHHAYSASEGATLSQLGQDHKYVISTLKDAVKLRRVWPAKGPRLWYVSQAVEVSTGSVFIDTMVRQLLSF